MSRALLRSTVCAARASARPWATTAPAPIASALIRRSVSTLKLESQQKALSSHLQEADPAMFQIIEKEKTRQKQFINLIPSENFTSQAVLDALGSPMQSTSD